MLRRTYLALTAATYTTAANVDATLDVVEAKVDGKVDGKAAAGGANFLEASAAASCGLRLRARARALRRARGTSRFFRDHAAFTASDSTTWGTLSLAAPLSPPVRQLLAVGRDCVKYVRSVH